MKYLPASWLSIAFSEVDLMFQFCLPYWNHLLNLTTGKNLNGFDATARYMIFTSVTVFTLIFDPMTHN